MPAFKYLTMPYLWDKHMLIHPYPSIRHVQLRLAENKAMPKPSYIIWNRVYNIHISIRESLGGECAKAYQLNTASLLQFDEFREVH